MAEIHNTNVCCIDLVADCIDYLKGLGLAVFEGSFGSVFTINWDNSYSHSRYVLSDVSLPENLHEYHVFIGDTNHPNHRKYVPNEHQVSNITDPEEKCLTCSRPINILDLRPYGTSELSKFFKNNHNHKRIEIVFLGAHNSVAYTSSVVEYMKSYPLGSFSNYDAWGLLYGDSKEGNRVVFEENRESRMLFDGKLNQVRYYYTFRRPYIGQGESREEDPHFLSLLRNEDGECISYLYCTNSGSVFCVLPQVDQKSSLLKSLFENIIFPICSEYFPDIEAKRWIHKSDYELPAEKAVREKIAAKREEYEKEIAALESEAVEAGKKNEFLKKILTSTGGQLVHAVKTYLEWLGFKDVIDKDETLLEGEIKEEDLDLKYNGQLVLLEVKGINGTSTDSECSQVNKIVLRRMKQLKTTDVHGVYIVNNQKNIEPLSRQVPPFNENQISDSENQDRTLIYTAQLFAVFSDIENGYITKEEVRECFLKPGLVDFHAGFESLGKPYDYFKDNTVICHNLMGNRISVGDTLYYKDPLQKLVGLKVLSIHQGKTSFDTVDEGKTGIMVDKIVPKGTEIFIKHES